MAVSFIFEKGNVMLRSIKHMCGDKLGALDGKIGHIKDFYFDDQHWAIRYVVADTGPWIMGRLVLISPHAFKHLPESGKILPVNLTRQQIEDSPSIEDHKPVSRQYEEAYYRYYGWPYYWEGEGVWGNMGGFPIVTGPPAQLSGELPSKFKPKGVDVHLRSVKSLLGCQVQTGKSLAGHVEDFMMDDRSWVINHLVVNTGNMFSGKKVLLSPERVDWISWEDSKIVVNVTKRAILRYPAVDTDAPGVVSETVIEKPKRKKATTII